MCPDEFDLLTRLLNGGRPSLATQAARQVLLEGAGQAEAGRDAGITRATVHNALTRIQRLDQTVRAIYCPANGGPAPAFGAPLCQALVGLLGGDPGSPVNQAVMLALAEGTPQAEAARRHGITPVPVSTTLKRLRSIDAQIRAAYQLKK